MKGARINIDLHMYMHALKRILTIFPPESHAIGAAHQYWRRDRGPHSSAGERVGLGSGPLFGLELKVRFNGSLMPKFIISLSVYSVHRIVF